jgi:hypothetical protein
MDMSLVSPTNKVFAPRLLPRMLIRTLPSRLESRLLPNEGAHHTGFGYEKIVKYLIDAAVVSRPAS